MRFCKYCGNPLNPNHKVCTRCGKPTGYSEQSMSRNDVRLPYPPGRYSDAYQFKKPNKPLIIISILVAVIAITLISVFIFLKHQLSPEQSVDQISDALKKEDHRQLSKLLTSGGKKLNDNQAHAYLRFLKNEGKLNELSQDLKDSLKNLKTSKAKTHTISINQLAIIKIEKNGKRFGVFDHYTFNIPKYSIAMYSHDDGKINYDYNGQTHTINLKKDESVEVGTFPLGNYQLDAKKQVGNQTFKGNITILMTPARSIVKENFKEKRFMIKPNHTYKVNDIKLFINNKVDERFDENKVYGPYNSNDNIVVHLEGKIGKHTVKTNSERVGLPEGTEEYKTIELSFNSEEINKYEDESNESDDSSGSDKDDKEKKDRDDGDEGTSEDHKSKDDEDKEDNTEKRVKADLTQTEAINIIKKYENDKFESKDYSFELQPYQSSSNNIVKVKNNKGKLIYTYKIYTPIKFIYKTDSENNYISSGVYEGI